MSSQQSLWHSLDARHIRSSPRRTRSPDHPGAISVRPGDPSAAPCASGRGAGAVRHEDALHTVQPVIRPAARGAAQAVGLHAETTK
jgi:hypothetical protein